MFAGFDFPDYSLQDMASLFDELNDPRLPPF
jgi:hypothetical protein